MQNPNEFNMVEKPIINALEKLGYIYLTADAVDKIREDKHAVILKSIFIESVKKLNNIDTDEANRLYMQFIRVTDNEESLKLIRGRKSFKFSGEKQSESVDYIDYDNPENNVFAVVNQVKIHGIKNCIPDLIIYVNGIPLVVIECKGPIANQDIYTGIKQIQEYERDIPKLFQTNMFNISTDGNKTLYGATNSGSKYYLEFKDPYPKNVKDFESEIDMACYCLLDKERLLDLVYNYVLFEVRDKVTTKKICRYQQFRAVKKIVDRVVDGKKKKGLIWHTQGSGKSLTMFYSAYKLK
jgi:type I restriction enzyme R subunit